MTSQTCSNLSLSATISKHISISEYMYLFVFQGAALAPTSLGFSAKLLTTEVNQLSTPIGQMICGAAVIDDFLALRLLSDIKVIFMVFVYVIILFIYMGFSISPFSEFIICVCG